MCSLPFILGNHCSNWLYCQHQKSAEADETQLYKVVYFVLDSCTVYYFFDWLSSFMFHPNCIFNIQILLFVLRRVHIFKLLHLDVAEIPEPLIIFHLLSVLQYQSNAE